jgi:hypothetical protein
MTIEESLQPVEKPTYISGSSKYKEESKINTYRRTARIVGALFLIAMVASLLGGGLVESVIAASGYLMAVSANEAQVITGVLLELINGIAVLGIGVLMFPILKRHNETIALGYLGFRIIESVFCSIIIISPLSLIGPYANLGKRAL